MEDLGSNYSSKEDEEEGGKGGGPPPWMLCQGVSDSLKNELRSSPGVDGSLEGSLRPSKSWSPKLRLS